MKIYFSEKRTFTKNQGKILSNGFGKGEWGGRENNFGTRVGSILQNGGCVYIGSCVAAIGTLIQNIYRYMVIYMAIKGRE